MTENVHGVLSLIMTNEGVKKLVTPAFDDECANSRNVVAVLPAQHDLRLFVQQSAFTLHGTGESLEKWRAELLRDEGEHTKLMQAALIPPSSKPEIRNDLERLGVHEASLFPDLANLARNIARDDRHRKR